MAEASYHTGVRGVRNSKRALTFCCSSGVSLLGVRKKQGRSEEKKKRDE
jgi:hypothetical protein